MAVLAKVLTDKDPALQLRALQSLQLATGQNIELDINRWQAYIAAQAPPSSPRPQMSESDGGGPAMLATQPSVELLSR